MAADQLSKKNPDGTVLGQSATDKIAFFGCTPVVKLALTCIGATCVIASMNAKYNTLVLNLRNIGLST